MDEGKLHRLKARIPAALREQVIDGSETLDDHQSVVVRRDGSAINLGVADDLMRSLTPRLYDPAWLEDRAACDRWLAPRLHYSLRLTRAEAGDRDLWSWLAIRYNSYVVWRWEKANGDLNEERWDGPVHKQALMRLWWGAELFRDGHDYVPVERAFQRQDILHNYLHRPLIRCRSLALALVELAVPSTGRALLGSAEIRDLARVLNLATAGSPPELETGLQQDDHRAYEEWLQLPVSVPDWNELPSGPAGSDTSQASRAGALNIIQRCASYAAQAKAQ